MPELKRLWLAILRDYADFRRVRRYLGGEWVQVFRRDTGALGCQGYELWVRPDEVMEGDQEIGREDYTEAE